MSLFEAKRGHLRILVAGGVSHSHSGRYRPPSTLSQVARRVDLVTQTPHPRAEELATAGLALTARWVGQLLHGRRVLDASPSIGPATSHLLSESSELVIVSPRSSVVDAVPYLVGAAVKAHRAELAHLPFEDSSFDAIVSLAPDIQDAPLHPDVIAEFRRVLGPSDGLLVLAFPDPQEHGSTRAILLEESSLKAFLQSHFSEVAFVEHRTQLTSAFVLTSRRPTEPSFGAFPVSPTSPRYPETIALASNAPLPHAALPATISLPFDLAETQLAAARFASLVREYQAQALMTQQLSDDRARLLTELLSAEQGFAPEFDQRAQRGELDAHFGSTLEENLDATQRQLADARAQLAAHQSTISWRVTKPLRTVRRLLP